uniref:C2 domain-containing protein n=2 Tax=Kalmanozyma brasiliensis (strain GHG001) TaxID=1365824 RepID=V5EY94_KALBG
MPDSPTPNKRASMISNASSSRKEQPAQGDVSALAQTTLGMTLGAHESEEARPDIDPRGYDAQAAFKETIPLTMLFFAGTLVAALVLARYSIVAAALISGCSGHILYKKLNERGDDAKWALEMEASARRLAMPGAGEESVEWLNKALATAWPLINADYFAPFIDLLEDSLMTQVPGIVHSVRVDDMDQGSIPLRVKSFRVLPSDDRAFLKGAVAQAHKDAGKSAADAPPMHQTESDDDQENVDVGDFVNLEVTFAYRGAAPKKGMFRSTTNTNSGPLNTSGPVAADANDGDEDDAELQDLPTERIHLLLNLSVGLQKLAAVSIPVWIEMVGIEGKARVRLQMTPVAPFVKSAALTFVGAPTLEMSAKPLGKKMVIDAMNLPFMSTYVLHAVEDVIKGFIAPLSYTIDVAGLLGAGDGPQDVYALGVICFVLHQADDLAAADSNGQSDPFVQASFARAGKPLFTSRIVRKKRDAVWQETGFLLVSPDEVRDHDRLRFTVFDADRFSADDPLGKVEISLHRLIHKFRPGGEARSTNLLETRTDKLLPMRKGNAVQGTLKYSVGFFGLAHAPGTGHAPSRRKLLQGTSTTVKNESDDIDLVSPIDGKRKADDKDDSAGLLPASGKLEDEPTESAADSDLSAYMTGFDKFVHGLGLPMDDDVLRQRKQRKARVQKLATMIEGAKQATAHPPLAELPSGILAFHIHSITGLEVPSTQRSLGTSKRLSAKPRHGLAPTDEKQAEGGAGGKLPSSYVQVFLNDEAIFRTRTKTLNPRPYINAGSERFIGDWTTARLDFAVRDARMREGDAILGCVGLQLADVLTKSSRSTGWYTLTGGLGYGKIRITLLFRSVELSVPRPLRGWNVGIVEIAKVKVTGVPQSLLDKKACHLSVETVGGKTSTDDTLPVDDYESGAGDAATVSYDWPLKEPIRLPVRQRYPNSLYLSLRTDSRLPGRSHHHAWAFVPLNRVADEMRIQRRIRLFETSDWDEVEQDVLRATSDPKLLQTQDDSVKSKLLPVLEDVCHTGSATISDEALRAANLKAVGWIEIDMIFHRGIAPEHRSCTAGDSEMRFAFESYMTLLDAGERARPRTLASERRSPSKAASTHRRTASNTSDLGLSTSQSAQFGEDVGDDDDSLYAQSLTESQLDELASDADSDSPEGRRAQARALHRNQRGAAQIKGFRTLTWMKTNAEDSMAKMKRQFESKKSKRIGKMEAEGISHF